jgi:hypothetical protein
LIFGKNCLSIVEMQLVLLWVKDDTLKHLNGRKWQEIELGGKKVDCKFMKKEKNNHRSKACDLA